MVSYLINNPAFGGTNLVPDFFDIGWEDYLREMQIDGTFSDKTTLLAISEIFNVEFEVISTLYADEICLMFQHKNITETETALTKNFSMLCDWSVDHKLSIYFGEDKARSMLSGSKHKIMNSKSLTIQYDDIKIKQCSKVTYLGSIFDKTLSGEFMAIGVIMRSIPG